MPNVLTLILCTVLSAAGCVRSPEATKARYLERGDKYLAEGQNREAILEYRNAFRLDTQSARAAKGLGLAHFNLGELAQAYAFLITAKGLDLTDRQVRLKLGSVLLLDGRFDDCWVEAVYVYSKEPQNLDALQLMAGAANNAEKLDSALRALKDVEGQLKDQAKFNIALGTVHFKRQDFGEAERSLRHAVTVDPKSIEAHLALGGFFIARRDLKSAEVEYRTAADLSPDKSKARLQLADVYLLEGKKDEAVGVLRGVTEKAPGFLPAWRRLASVALADKRYDDAKSAINAVLEKNPNDPEGRMLRGKLYLMQNDAGAAIQEFQSVLKLEPRSAPARYQLALAQLRVGNVGQAKSELAEATAAAPKWVEPAVLLAQLNLQTGAIQPAIDSLKKLVEDQPKNSKIQLLLGSAYLANKQPEQALEVYRKVRESDPKNARAVFFIGVTLRALGKLDESKKELESALLIEPSFAEALAQIVEIELIKKQPDAAVARVKQQIQAVPKSGKYHTLLAMLAKRRGDETESEAEFLEAINLEPELMQPYIALGEIYARSKRYDDALVKFDAALKVNPKNAGLLTIEGVVYQLRGENPKAIELYEKALAVNPRFGPAANNLAYLYSGDAKQKDRALELAQLAKEALPEDPRVSDTLGWILYQRGLYDGALRLILESAAKFPDNPEIQYHLGMAQHRLGNRDAARAALEQALKSGASYPGIEETKATLEELKK